MFRTICLSSLAALLLASSASATTTIVDGYHGGTANNPFWANSDVIGLNEHWDVNKMEVTLDTENNLVTVAVFSQFFDNVGRRGVELGDLFISTNGWNPFGTAPYNQDDASNGEQWELAAVLDDHGPSLPTSEELGVSYLGKSGSLAVYEVLPGNIELANLPGGDFRQGQEAQYNPGQQAALFTGRWEITDILNDPYDVLTLTFAVSPDFFSLFTNFGFHWTMTCGNDVIEGGAEVPEPATVALMGLGLMGLLPRRKKD